MTSPKSLLPMPIIISTILSMGCLDFVEIEVLRSAEIQVTEDIQTLIVMDRAGPKNFGEELLAGVEGLGSAEGLLADKDARKAAIDTMSQGLRDSPRFEVIEFNVDAKQYGSSIWDVSMARWQAIDLCMQVQCDGIVSLDAFDSDTSLTEALEVAEGLDGEGDAGEIIWYELTRTTQTVATWRLYDGFSGDIIDEVREHKNGNILDASGATLEEALAGIPDGRSVVRGLAEQSAESYASRIAPYYETVYRHLYSTGSDAIEAGSDAFDRGDLNEAITIWTQCAQSEWAEEQGRCLFNLAVSQESRGDLDSAYANALEAHALLGAQRTLNYVRELASIRQ